MYFVHRTKFQHWLDSKLAAQGDEASRKHDRNWPHLHLSVSLSNALYRARVRARVYLLSLSISLLHQPTTLVSGDHRRCAEVNRVRVDGVALCPDLVENTSVRRESNKLTCSPLAARSLAVRSLVRSLVRSRRSRCRFLRGYETRRGCKIECCVTIDIIRFSVL